MSLTKTTRALFLASYEFLLITVPVGMYIALEVTHAKRSDILWTTPEWSMATIFLLFQGLSLYIRLLDSSGGKLSGTTIGLLGLVSLVFVAITLINAYKALDPLENTKASIAVRLTLLGFVSFAFLVFVAAAKLYQIKQERKTNGQKL